MSAAEPVEALPKLLPVDYRCWTCGSPFVEYDGWQYANLPLNTSEGGGESWCGACEVHGAGSVSPGDGEDRLADWVAYRAEHGLNDLEEADDEFLRDVQTQLDALECERLNLLDGLRRFNDARRGVRS